MWNDATQTNGAAGSQGGRCGCSALLNLDTGGFSLNRLCTRVWLGELLKRGLSVEEDSVDSV